MEASKNEMLDKKIIFFDGICHLCNSFVDFIIQKDQQKRLYFAPLQGSTAQKLLPKDLTQNLGSVIYFRRGELLQESQAVLQVFSDLGGVYKCALIFKMIPNFIRNKIYRWVAKNRYAWFGQRDFCRLPTPAEKDFLLP